MLGCVSTPSISSKMATGDFKTVAEIELVHSVRIIYSVFDTEKGKINLYL